MLPMKQDTRIPTSISRTLVQLFPAEQVTLCSNVGVTLMDGVNSVRLPVYTKVMLMFDC